MILPGFLGFAAAAGGSLATVYQRWAGTFGEAPGIGYLCDNLLVSSAAQGSPGCAAGDKGYDAGKFTFEIELTVQPSSAAERSRVGIVEASADLNSSPLIGTSAGTVGYSGKTSPIIEIDGSSVAASATAGAGDVIGVACDFDNWTVQLFKNGVSLHVAQAITPGTYFPAVSVVTTGDPQEMVPNFGSRPFAYPAFVPVGFTKGWPAGETTFYSQLAFQYGGTVVYSNHDRTLTATAAHICRGNVFLTAGQHYFEAVCSAFVADCTVGLVKPTGISNNTLGADTGSIGRRGVFVYDGISNNNIGSAPSVGTVQGFLVNLDTGKFACYNDGTLIAGNLPLPLWTAGQAWTPAANTIGTNPMAVTLNCDPADIVYPDVATDNGAAIGWAIQPIQITNTSAPTITGTAEVGAELTVSSPGTWTGNTLTYYNWYSDGVLSVYNTGGPAYTVGEDDNGTTITCVLTGLNDYTCLISGFSSNGIAIPVSAVPTNTVAPTISGSAVVNNTLTVNVGTWVAHPPVDYYEYAWYSGTDYVSGDDSYFTDISDVGKAITCRVDACNGLGCSDPPTVSSNSITVGTIPINDSPPTVSGNDPADIGDTLTVDIGSWTAYPAPTITYRWQRDGVDIIGATATTHVVVAADINTFVGCVVTETNTYGATPVPSDNQISCQTAPPENTVAPVASGTPVVGQVLSVTNGTWTSLATPLTYSYQWLSDGDPVGTNANTYTVQLSDTGKTVWCSVTATDSAAYGGQQGYADSNGLSIT